MKTFWERFARLNAPLIAASLRKVADEVELLLPGSPVLGYLLLLKGDPQMGSITVKDSDAPFRASVSFVDAKGSPTSPDSTPTWASDDTSVVSVAVDDDGLGATLTPGSPGASAAATAQVTVTTTNTDGTVVTAVGAVTVTSGEAAIGDVQFEVPAPEPPAPTP